VVKTMIKEDLTKEERALLANEIAIHEVCDHPNIVRIFESFEEPRKVHIAMEVCDGGCLFDHVDTQGGTLNEADARIVMQQVLQALFYLHNVKNVAHRDLKQENILLKHKEVSLENNAIKLIDFGLAGTFTPGRRTLEGFCGTPAYMAPELMWGAYDEKCDIWSCGVLLYELLCGDVPFNDESPRRILLKASRDPICLRGETWHAVSADAKAAVRGMLRTDPRTRASAEGALGTAWLRGRGPCGSGPADSPSAEAISENLRSFSSLSDFQRVALRFAAYHLDDPQVEEQRKVFLRIDRNGDGQLTLEEFGEGCPELGLDASEAMDLFMQLDTDGSGAVEYSEFLGAATCRDSLPSHAYWEAFRLCDKDGSGLISAAEVQAVVGRKGYKAECTCFAWSKGAAESEEMDFEKFVSTMRRRSSAGGA